MKKENAPGAGRAVDDKTGPYEEELHLLAERLRRGDCVLFAGAGVSAEALPKWSELVERLSNDLPGFRAKGLTPRDFLDVAQWYVEEHGRERLLRELVSIYGSPAIEPTQLARALALLPARVIFTTNYDLILETALRENQSPPDVVVSDRYIALIDERAGTTLVKMHGSVTHPESILLTREDYATYGETHRATITYLQSLLATRTFLFVGFSFSDPNFRLIYEAIQRALGRYRRPAYALIPDPDNSLMVRHWERNGVRMLTFDGANPEEEILRFVQRLSGRVAAQTERSELLEFVRALSEDGERLGFVQAAEIARHLEQVGELVSGIFDQAAKQNYLRERLPPEDAREAEALAEEKVRALYGLARIMEPLGFGVAGEHWARLGNELLARGDMEAAAEAYHRAIARIRPGGRVAGTEIGRHLLGNLARVQIRLARFSRGINLLHGLVLARTERGPAVDAGWLAKRPSDLIVLAEATNRIAEEMIADEQPEQARGVLAEVRRWLAEGLRTGLYAGEAPPARRNRARLLVALGDSHWHSYEIALRRLDLRAARRHHDQARRWFEEAVEAEAYFVPAWRMLMRLACEDAFGHDPAQSGPKALAGRLDAMAKSEEGRQVRDAVRESWPSAWRNGAR